jgi:riboflavin kinase / FMN adenylyltransferase
MLTIRHSPHFRIEMPTIATIGTFDGVHLGHRKILSRLLELKAATGMPTVVLTFDPHPRKVLFPDQQDLKLITTTDEKLALLENAGVDIAVVYPFTEEFSQMDPAAYITGLLGGSLRVKKLVIGYDHRFGHARKGNIDTLRSQSALVGYEIEEISALDIDNINISSTRIRRAIEEGNLDLASEFLGRQFSLTGRVIKGKQLGRKLGYPTANLRVDRDKLLPKPGIYCVEVTVGEEIHAGMMSIGINPTTDTDRTLKLEVNIFDFDRDIYENEISVRFMKRLRDEKKFNGLEELSRALAADKQACLEFMARTA